MTFRFLDTIHDGKSSPYFQHLKETVCTDIGRKNLKLDYLRSKGYRKSPDENGERDYITEEQFGILLYLEQLYHDTYLRLGCERFWKDDEIEDNKEFARELRDKKRLTRGPWRTGLDNTDSFKKSYSIEI